MQTNDQELKRGLGERHIRLIALGAAIGVGLFLGSANAIKLAGHAAISFHIVSHIQSPPCCSGIAGSAR